jgi:hypothetical protein
MRTVYEVFSQFNSRISAGVHFCDTVSQARAYLREQQALRTQS